MSHRGLASFDLTQLASQSPPDLRVRSECWKGQIPILFALAPHEVTSMEDPPPLAVRIASTRSTRDAHMQAHRQHSPSEGGRGERSTRDSAELADLSALLLR